MKEYRELAWAIERILHKYMKYEKKSQTYCEDVILSQPEIHTVAIIGEKKGINITSLAKERGITKGAVSQMIYKLCDKGLVEKRVSPNSDSELCLYLTDKGKKASTEHRKKHEKMRKSFESLIDNISKKNQKKIITFLNEFEEEIDKYI